MCHLWRLNTQDNEISIDDCKKFIDSLAQFDGEPVEVHIIGGESLIKKGILELIKYISNRGSRTVVTSCGYTIDEKLAKAIVDSGLSMLNISLESLDPAVHNFLRGKEDCFQRVIGAIDYLSKFKDNRLKLGINTVISAKNLGGIVELVEWTTHNKQLDSIYFMAIMRPFGSDLGWDWFKKEEYSYLWPTDYSKIEAVLDALIALKNNKSSKIENSVGQLKVFKSYFKNPLNFIKVNRCNVPEQAININALGDAYICFFMDKLGNIKNDNVVELWNSERAEEVRKKMLSCRNNCELVVNCYYGD
jgi:MoaA/NifB/PqqE/SkfB family radical SAM enzyme